ncbi:hypothetical protein IFM89_025366 [Coptis chinensis]|uniref:Cullin family profile domain-containing protein n=1 Tax=Coptis chinensis TaxID=261450 RepID=A0A835HCW9_9MAGN|nr:hypothetical protein IFM89_025366 [Coptis chinensis]
MFRAFHQGTDGPIPFLVCLKSTLRTKEGAKLSDEAIEETLEKIVKLLAYINDKDLFAEFCRKNSLRRSMEDFKEYYKTKMKHRKLTWIYSLGTCIVTGKFEQRNIELVVTTYQAALLLLFNEVNEPGSLSYSDIKEQLNLAEDDVTRLFSLWLVRNTKY